MNAATGDAAAMATDVPANAVGAGAVSPGGENLPRGGLHRQMLASVGRVRGTARTYETKSWVPRWPGFEPYRYRGPCADKISTEKP